MKLNYENKLKICEWFREKSIEPTGNPLVLFEYYKENQFYGEITKSRSITNICWVIKKQIDFIQKSVVNIKYEHNTKNTNNLNSGYVYAIGNPAWNNYIKIGTSVDVYDRLNSYQTSCPLRDYYLIDYIYSDDRFELEKYIISHHISKNEWIETTESKIKSLFRRIKSYPEMEILRFALVVSMNNWLHEIKSDNDKNLFRSCVRSHIDAISKLTNLEKPEILSLTKTRVIQKNNSYYFDKIPLSFNLRSRKIKLQM